jgi:periplasmic divalent cation tolerance protein
MAGEGYVQVTFMIGTEEAAREVARIAVAQRKAACATVMSGPVYSQFWWGGKVDNTTEWMVMTKTTAALVEELVALIKSRHTDETPDITVTPIIGGFPGYLEWIGAETAAGERAS